MSELNNTPASVDDGIPEVDFELTASEVVQAPVDDSLTISGMAADAKATGEAIAAAKSELEEQIEDIETGVESVAGKLFPVGSIYVSTLSTAPTFGGTNWRWQEIKMPATWGDLEDGFRSFAPIATGDETGTLHFWLRLADAETEG